MKLVATRNDIILNLETIEQYLQSEMPDIYDAMTTYIARGKCFIAYLVNGQYHFAPSRFVGYKGNSLARHKANAYKHGWDTNPAVSEVLDQKNQFNEELEKAYLAFCDILGVTPNDNKRTQRKYWLMEGDVAGDFNSSYFTEGARKMITHKISERNQKVVQEAKRIFKQEHDGELFCEICGFNFKVAYGKVGDGFIEAHHKVSLSSTTKEHKVKPSDLMMVCPNCHRMLHRKVNGKYMSIKQLHKALNKTDRK